MNQQSYEDIAVVGLQLKFPGATTIDEFWQNLCNGVESINQFTREELVAGGIRPDVIDNPNFVKRYPTIPDIELFDADFFGFSPRDAEVIDPQMRMFLELSWSALEMAGYDSKRYAGLVGVYAGINMSNYFLECVRPSLHLFNAMSANCFNDKDALATLVAYKLDLKGPAITNQSFCSTALVSIHLACRSLHLRESDMALAGGTNLNHREPAGYTYDEGSMLSRDGKCRTFDENANGTLFGNGAGVVVLKRLDDAIREGDTIHGIIKGSAVNNDGSVKAGYTAPSMDGQRKCVEMAIERSGINPETIGFVEAHGTATPIGDPIEVEALTKAWRRHTEKKNYCAIGSVKTNFGHLDRAAGVATFIKALLTVKNGKIPPVVGFEKPNPALKIETTPFFVNNKLEDWKVEGTRRAAMSGLGFGGTNAHMIIEEAPSTEESGPSRSKQLLLLAGRTTFAVDKMAENLAKHLQKNTDQNFADAAYTLQVGRRHFSHRRAWVAEDANDAISQLEGTLPELGEGRYTADRTVSFLFPGQGAQYINMGKELYDTEPLFRTTVDECCELLKPHLGSDLREVLYPAAASDNAADKLKQTSFTQPALFVIEYAMAKLLMSWGIMPEAMIGHSIGEYVAACIAEVFSPEDALRLVAARGKLMQSCETGSMLALPLPEEEVKDLLSDEVSLAAVNAEGSCVLSGTDEALAKVQDTLKEKGMEGRLLETSHAFHSHMMDPILNEFKEVVAKVTLRKPERKFISNLSGQWIEDAEATDPDYWVKHLRQAVRFAAGVKTLVRESTSALVEVGPGRTLATLSKRVSGLAPHVPVINTMRHPKDEGSDLTHLFRTIALLWESGVNPDWVAFSQGEKRRRIPLPTYVFERKYFWVDPTSNANDQVHTPAKQEKLDDWFSLPVWKQGGNPFSLAEHKEKAEGNWLILADHSSLTQEIIRKLSDSGITPTVVQSGDTYGLKDGIFTVRPSEASDIDQVIEELEHEDKIPEFILHTWNLSPDPAQNGRLSTLEETENNAFYSVLFLVQALTKRNLQKAARVGVLSNDLQQVRKEAILRPERALLMGPVKVAAKENPQIESFTIDVQLSGNEEPTLADQILGEFCFEPANQVVAHRGDRRWFLSYEPNPQPETDVAKLPFQEGGVYLVTGGLGGIGLTLAEYLTEHWKAKLVLTSRKGLPPRQKWEGQLGAGHDDNALTRRIRKVLDLEKKGGQVRVIAADVADREAMMKAIAEVEEEFGTIQGVLHTAGLPGGGIMQLKTRDIAAKVLNPKVRGTLVLEEVFKDRSLEFFGLFSSMASVAAPFGQVDYAAANSYLDAYAAYSRSSSHKNVIAMNWADWAEVGMAVETSFRLGVENLGLTEKQGEPVEHPYISRRRDNGDSISYIIELDADRDWYLKEHVLFGRPTLSGSTFIELGRAAYELETGQEQMHLREVFFTKPCSVEAGSKREIEVMLTKDGENYTFKVRGKDVNDSTIWEDFAQGQVGPIKDEPGKLDLDALRAKCNRGKDRMGEKKEEKNAETGLNLNLGVRWDNLESIRVANDRYFVSVHELPDEAKADVESMKLHPAFTDFTGVLPNDVLDPHLPFFTGSIKVYKPLPARLCSYALSVDLGEKGETRRYECTFTDDEGNVLVEMKEWTLRRLAALDAPKIDVEEPQSETEESKEEDAKRTFTIGMKDAGMLDTIQQVEIDRRAPGKGEVEIEVASAGMNFRDVLRALGMLSADHDAGLAVVGLGGECSGKVARVGPGVTNVKVGDDVVAFAAKSFSGYVTVSSMAVAPLPESLSFEEGAAVPMVFLTAYYALHELCRLQKGERVLIHSAAGGVGLAAVQYAQHVGAEIYATASPKKHDYLRSLGIEHITTSRELSFADDIREWTNGEGVDVVLNALSGDFITKSFELLRPFGRFVEIGARDIYQNTPLGMRPFSNSVSFSAFDLGVIFVAKPHIGRELLSDVLNGFETGIFSPLPAEVFPLDQASNAFQHMAAARHIGKVVISVNPMEKGGAQEESDVSSEEKAKAKKRTSRDLSDAILPEEGVLCFERALASAQPQILICARSLKSVMDVHQTAKNIQQQEANKPAQANAPASKKHPRPALPTPFQEPESDMEKLLAVIWQDILGIEAVDVNDNFFELGGDSLLGVQLFSRVKSEMNAQLSPGTLYEAPTIAQFAKVLEGETGTGGDQEENEQGETAAERAERRRARREARRAKAKAGQS